MAKEALINGKIYYLPEKDEWETTSPKRLWYVKSCPVTGGHCKCEAALYRQLCCFCGERAVDLDALAQLTDLEPPHTPMGHKSQLHYPQGLLCAASEGIRGGLAHCQCFKAYVQGHCCHCGEPWEACGER